jgi:hypothetical protein
MSEERLILGQASLHAFETCRRQFQLRYLRRLPWPERPPQEETAAAMARGRQFHQVLQQHFLGLAVDPALIGDETVRRWWAAFRRADLKLPAGTLYPEVSLSVPAGEHLLRGRFDLLIAGEGENGRFAHIFDWKTGNPQPEAILRGQWQTRLYLALLAEGGGAFWPGAAAPPDPAQIALTYWYVADPDAPRTIRYNAAWRRRNWEAIRALLKQISAAQRADEWPLTADWTPCRTCAYQVYCDRQEAGTAAQDPPLEETDEADTAVSLPSLAPDLP